MNFVCRAAVALVLTTAAWPTFTADYFWNCTTPDGTKYADASKCDKGDIAVKVMKGGSAVPAAQTATVQATLGDTTPVNTHTAVCPNNPNVCKLPNFGVTEGSPRAQAITQFMREKECDFMQRFPNRCSKPRD